MNGRPLVSVVIPAWNAEATLGETLRSVASQTYRDLEILIVDDGSTDRTAEIASEFCAGEPRARLIRQPNGGVASARNRAIAEARGDWIAPVDADDLWHPAKIDKQVAAALTALERPGFVYCWYHCIDQQGRAVGSGPRWAISGRAYYRLAYLNPVGNGSALLLAREAIVEAGGYDERLRSEQAQGCEDVLLQLRIARRRPIALVPEHLVGYRVRPGRMSGDQAQMLRSWRLAYERIETEGGALPPKVKRWISGKCHFDIAEQHAVAGARGKALRSMARAIGLDPVRSGSRLLHRAARLAVRAIGSERRRAESMPFADADPVVAIRPDDVLPGMARLVERIDSARLKRLAGSEAQP